MMDWEKVEKLSTDLMRLIIQNELTFEETLSALNLTTALLAVTSESPNYTRRFVLKSIKYFFYRARRERKVAHVRDVK